MSGRTANYRDDEDVILCQAFMDISQDPIIGISQSSKKFWARVATVFNNSKNPSYADRGPRSLQCRYSDIEAGVKRLVHSVKHVELQNPSGASEQTILERAKIFYVNTDKPQFKNGFKYDHVWNMLKDFEKFNDNNPTSPQISRKHLFDHVSSQSDNQSPNCDTPDSTGFSQFSVDLNDDDDNVGGSSSQRPIGVKKAKLKKKVEEERAKDMNEMKAQNEEVVELMRKAAEDRTHYFEMREKELYLKEQEVLLRKQEVEMHQQQMQMHQQQMEMHKKNKELAREDKILARDLSSISDETIRALLQVEQVNIMQKRAQENQYSYPSSASNYYGSYFPNFGGSGSDLPPF